MPNKEKLEQELASNSYLASQHEENEMVIKTSRVLEILGEKELNNTVDNKIEETQILSRVLEYKKYPKYITLNLDGADYEFITQEDADKLVDKAVKQREQEIKNDLLKIADEGEYEDLRRECENYFS